MIEVKTRYEQRNDSINNTADTCTDCDSYNRNSGISEEITIIQARICKGVSDAKSVQSSFPASTTISPNEVDCDSDIDPQVSNEDYCSGYQHGFADTTNELLTI